MKWENLRYKMEGSRREGEGNGLRNRERER